MQLIGVPYSHQYVARSMELADSREWLSWGKWEALQRFTLDHVVEWFEKYENIWMSTFVSLKRMSVFLKCTNRLGSPYSLLSIKCVGSIVLERTASQFKHSMLTKERNSLSCKLRGYSWIMLHKYRRNPSHICTSRNNINWVGVKSVWEISYPPCEWCKSG